MKRQFVTPLKGKMDDNVKVPVTNKPAKLPRTYGSSKRVLRLLPPLQLVVMI